MFSWEAATHSCHRVRVMIMASIRRRNSLTKGKQKDNPESKLQDLWLCLDISWGYYLGRRDFTLGKHISWQKSVHWWRTLQMIRSWGLPLETETEMKWGKGPPFFNFPTTYNVTHTLTLHPFKNGVSSDSKSLKNMQTLHWNQWVLQLEEQPQRF